MEISLNILENHKILCPHRDNCLCVILKLF